MKILLVNPPNCGRSISQEKYGLQPTHKIFHGEPLALEELAGNLSEHDVKILDLKVDKRPFINVLESFNPDLVGFTSLTCEAQTVLKLCKEVKNWNAHTYTVVGGIHASSCPEDFMSCNIIDYIIIGLGKVAFEQLISSIEQQYVYSIPGVFSVSSKIRSFIPRNPTKFDLVSSLSPRYDLVDEYRKHYQILPGLEVGFVATAIGCPNRCSFCCIGNTCSKYLTYEIKDVIRNIKQLKAPMIRLVDANTFGNIHRAKKLAAEIAKANIKKHFIVDACADTIVRHKDTFKLWRDIGLRAVVVGFEEINNEILTQWNKKNSYGIIKRAIEILHDLGISIIGDFIISPEYDQSDFQRLGDFVSNSKIECPVFTILTPLPGTKLYNSMKDEILVKDLDYYTLTNAVVSTKLSEKDFYQLYVDFSMHFYQQITTL